MRTVCSRLLPSRRTNSLLMLVGGFTLSMLVGCGGGSSSQQPLPPVMPKVALTTLSTDTFSNGSSQHKTEVEAAASSFGSTIVSAFQVGRIFSGGASDIGFATSLDAGTTWTSGFLPGITVFQGGVNFTAASDAAVAFDAKHGVWMISTLPILTVAQVAISRSVDGINWQNPIIVSDTPDSDKNWIACDNTAASPFYGHCYVEWDDPSANGLIWMTTSNDGGLTWSVPLTTAAFDQGIGGQPVVQPNGNVVVPAESFLNASQAAFTSTDGGVSWNPAVTISTISDHIAAGGLRTSPLPSAAVDASGIVYVVWQDCRFRSGCASNDLVLSTSTDGNTWTAPARIPIDPLTSTADHFIPGLAVDAATGGSLAHLGLTYYFYPVANCIVSTCALNAGFISSHDGGSTWNAPTTLIGPISLASLPNTFAGLMVGDYVSTAFAGGKAFSIFEAATAKVGSLFDEPTYATTSGFTVAENGGMTSAGELPVPGAHSDHGPRQFYDQEHRYPVPPD